jgi:heptosyltransferase-1
VDYEGPGTMNILIVKLSAIGDVVHTLPSLTALRTLYPDAHITWVVEEASSDIILNHPHLDRILVSRRKYWVDNLKKFRNVSETITEIRSLISDLKDRHYDLVIDFHGLLKSSLFVFLSGGKRKLGYNSMQEMSGLFIDEKIFEDMSKHAVDRYMDFSRYLGAEVEQPEFFISIEEDNKTRVKRLLRENNIDSADPFVAINAIAFWETKLWDNDKFARLCDRIVKELHYPVVFTGSASDGSIERIRLMMTQPSINLEGQTSLRDLAYLYTLSALLVTTDSGPMHIAAAVKTPTVALFGPTDPTRTGPYGKNHIVIRKELPCSPCFLKRCDTNRCMQEISTDEVFEAIKTVMKNRLGVD